MGVGALLRKYLDDTQDYNSLTVRNILNNLGAPLQKACDSSISPEDQDFAIASLKGLGNAQYINSDIEDSIVKIIMDEAALPRIRAAALDMVKIYAQNSKVRTFYITNKIPHKGRMVLCDMCHISITIFFYNRQYCINKSRWTI